MSNKRIILITGSSAGLGRQCALKIATEHPTTHRVVIASRNLASVKGAVDDIRKELNPGQQDAVVACAVSLDLASLESVKSFAKWAAVEFPVIDSLVLNAGMGPSDIVKTKDGFESVFAVNHLGHFYLTRLLLPNLLKSPQPRLVVVSSGMHNPMYKFGPPVVWTPESPTDWAYGDPSVATPNMVYCFSKLCNVLFAYELRSRIPDPRLTILIFDPGFCRDTNIRRSFNWAVRGLVDYGISGYIWVQEKTGLLPHRQLSDSVESGNLLASYSVDAGWAGEKPRYFAIATETESSVDSYNKDYQRILWEFSERVVGEKIGKLGL
ncbi:hypothetical protein BJ742DRAFT_706815 [Cladochytrium replicatum]|nr:hypothetical protein BJ742DRAFT_706815 [Cladochytrium replicatum]